MAETTVKKSSPILIAVAWIIVIIPTAWGFRYTLQNAMKLFTSTPAQLRPLNNPHASSPQRDMLLPHGTR